MGGLKFAGCAEVELRQMMGGGAVSWQHAGCCQKAAWARHQACQLDDLVLMRVGMRGPLRRLFRFASSGHQGRRICVRRAADAGT